MTQQEQDNLKNQGNEAYQRGDYRLAIYFFSKGLELSSGLPSDFVLYSNRSAAYCQLGDYQRALADSEMVITIKPDWPKGYSRKAQALEYMKKYKEAISAYEVGLQLEPGNDVMTKGMEECLEKRSRIDCKGFDKNVSASTTASIQRAQGLPFWKDVTWHLEITKERIWLEDGPKTPFRPRSIFLIDSGKLQIANVAPHCARDSITLDELLDFVAQSCFKHSIRPGTLEVVDPKLASMLRQHLINMGLEVVPVQMSDEKKKFLEDTFKFFDEQERQQWKSDPQYTGVLQQRAQMGLMSVAGVNTDLLRGLVTAANNFCRSKVYLYYTQGLGIRLESGGGTKVALVIRNAKNQYGLAMSTVEATKNPQHYGEQAVMFVDLNELPFDDADLFEQQGWKVVEEKYPYPIVFNPVSTDSSSGPTTLQRPTMEDLVWYEIALKAVTLFVENTFGNPTFMPPLDYSAQHRCLVHTHQGRQSVIVSVPPVHDAVPSLTHSEAAPRKEEDSFSVLTSPTSSGLASPSLSNVHQNSPVTIPNGHHSPVPSPSKSNQNPTNHTQSDTVDYPVKHPTTTHNTTQPEITPKSRQPRQQKEVPPPAQRSASPIHNTRTSSPGQSRRQNNPSPPAHELVVSDETMKYTAIPESPTSYEESDTRKSWHVTNSPTSSESRMRSALEAQLKEAHEKIKWQAGLLKGQETLVQQLQSQLRHNETLVAKMSTRIEELEKMQLSLVKELQSKTKMELGEGRQLLKEFSNCAMTILKSEGKVRQSSSVPLKTLIPSTGGAPSSTSGLPPRSQPLSYRPPSPRPQSSQIGTPTPKPNRSSRTTSPAQVRNARPVTPPTGRRNYDSDGHERSSSMERDFEDTTGEESGMSRISDPNSSRGRKIVSGGSSSSRSSSIGSSRKTMPSPTSTGQRSPRVGSNPSVNLQGNPAVLMGSSQQSSGQYSVVPPFGTSVDYWQTRQDVIHSTPTTTQNTNNGTYSVY